MRSLLFNAFFYGWTALCVTAGLPLLLAGLGGLVLMRRRRDG